MNKFDAAFTETFLSAGGQTGELLRSMDWHNHPLGPPAQWPQSLKTSVGIVLHSAYPMFIWWGPDLFTIYNDAYIPLMGNKHPHFLGKPAQDLWHEVWDDVLLPIKKRVFDKGEAIYAEDTMMLLERGGFLEENYFTFSYSPIMGENGLVEGLFCTSHEETRKVLERRRLHNLTSLSGKLATAETLIDIGRLAMEKVAENSNDIPYAAFYLIQNDEAVLTAATGLDSESGRAAFPAFIAYNDDNVCPIRTIIRTGKPAVVEGMRERMTEVPHFFSGQAPDRMYLQCINDTDGKPAAVLITAISPHCGFENGCRHYHETVATKITTSIRTLTTLLLETEARKRTEDSRKRFHEMIMEAPMGIAVLTGKDFTVEIANDSYLYLVDRKREDLEGKLLFEAIPELHGQAVESLLEDVFTTGEPFYGNEFETFLVRGGKRESRFFNFVYKPMRERGGRITGVLVVATDVTDMVKARHAIQENATQFRNMVMHSPIPMTIFRGADHVIEIANHVMLQNIWRKEEHEVLGKKALEAFPELNDQKYPALLKKVFDTATTYHETEAEVYVGGNDGMRKFYLDFEYAPLLETDGSVSGIMITVNDVTERVQARQRLEESETYFRRMADSVPVMIWITQKDGSCTYVNKQWHAYTGQNNANALGYGWMDATHPDDRDYTFDEFKVSMAAEGPLSVEYRLQNHDGEYRWVIAVGMPRFGADGLFEGYIGTVTDINDRKTAEEKIRESDERSRLAIDAAELGTYEWHIATEEIFPSERFMHIFGYEWEEKVDRHKLIRRIHPDDLIIHKTAHEQARITGTLNYEARLIWPDGSLHWMKIKGKVVRNELKDNEKMLGTVMDITDQKMAVAALQESELRYRQLIQALPVAVYTVDIQGSIVLYNKAAVSLWGREPENGEEKWCGSHGIYDSHGEWVPLDKCPMALALKENRAIITEIMVQRPDGEIRHALVHPQPVHDTAGRLTGAINAMVDITDLKRFEQALKTSESRLSEAQRIAGIGNWEYGYDDKSFYCSEEVYRILGTEPDRFAPSFYNLFRIIHPKDIKKLSRTLSFTRKTGLPFNIDFRILPDQKTVRHINSQGYVVLDDEHRIVKIIGTLQDITLRKLVEEELIEAKSVSEKSLRYKDQFLANMSHEIRTPMNAIVGFTELLLKTPLQPEQKQYIDAIQISGENLLVIINDILDFSRLEAGAIQFERINFKLSELISTLTDLMLPKSVEKGVKLSVNIDPTISDNLLGDPTRLNQILLNLVGNAIKFTEKGEVKISARPLWEDEENLELKFSVTDTGIGIEEHMFETIFDVFTQTASDTTRKYGGSGLGLAIVKQFVEKQGGRVGVESTLGKGSTFWVTLSFKKAAEPVAPEHAPVADNTPQRSTEGLRILLVEDNKLNQLLASKALSDWNCIVDVADNGLIALDKLSKGDYDVILMDIQLPEMDGYEATRYIRSSFPPPKCLVPIVAVTAHAMQTEAQKCRDAGMNGYISKPFSPKMLYEGVMNVINEAKTSPA